MSKKRYILGLNGQRDGKCIAESAKYAIVLRVAFRFHTHENPVFFSRVTVSFFFSQWHVELLLLLLHECLFESGWILSIKIIQAKGLPVKDAMLLC